MNNASRSAFGFTRIISCAAAVLLIATACSRNTPPAGESAKTDQTKAAAPSKTATTATTSSTAPAATSTPATATPATTPPVAPAKTPAATPSATPTPAAPAAQTTEKLVQVRLTTSLGDIVVELNQEKAPISVANFLNYVDKGFYSGTIFHRVISGFMIQGGGFTADMQQKKTDPPIKNEWQNGLKNEAYTIAMARTSVPDSATCQFFINSVNNPFLDRPNGGAAYAVFGKVISGTDVVDKIRAVKTGVKGGMPDVPLETVTIIKAEREPKK